MNRDTSLKKALLWAAFLTLSLLPGACRGSGYDEASGKGEARIVVSFSLPAGYDGTPSADGYEEGTAAENLIDVENACRVLFFSVHNIYLGSLERQAVASMDGERYRLYSLSGIPPEDLPSDFKIMIAANWPDMSAIDNAVVGATSIDDICHNAFSRFEAPEGFFLDPEQGSLMPMFGIHSYEGVTAAPGTTELKEPVTMLRALAKVEVRFDGDTEEGMPQVALCGFNTAGYCAPVAVYDQNDYGQGTDWENDYLHRLHLTTPDNNNDADAASRRILLTPQTDGAGYSVWTVYIPEYRNLLADGSAAPDEAFIEILLPYQNADETPFRIYFADYDGATTSDTGLPRRNIERNNLYRFKVSLQRGELIITTRPWNHRPQPDIQA